MQLLIADDEYIIREGLKSLEWASIGISSVLSAATGIEAQRILNENSIDIAILDIRMPGISGLELANYIQISKKQTMVILLTGYAEFEYARKAISFGVCEYILKPFRPRDLLELVAKICQKNLIRDSGETVSLSIPQQIEDCFLSVSPACKQMIAELSQNYASELSLDALAAKYHFSSAYLSRKIKTETGYSFLEILKAIRLSYAAGYLLKNEKISYICSQSGFQDQRYFSQVFKSIFNCSPSEFKIQQNKNVSFANILLKVAEKGKK